MQRLLDQESGATGEIFIPKEKTPLLMDATFFGRSYGLLVARANGKNIIWKEIDGEKIVYYQELLEDLKTLEFPFSSFVIDGRRGVKSLLQEMFPSLPIQHCQFHQKKTVINYISTKPRREASKEPLVITKTLVQSTKEEFSRELTKWYTKWEKFLKEKNRASINRKKNIYSQTTQKCIFFS